MKFMGTIIGPAGPLANALFNLVFFFKIYFFFASFKKKINKKGNFLPAVSIIDFKIIGKGGHGSVPEKCLDPSCLLFYFLLFLT